MIQAGPTVPTIDLLPDALPDLPAAPPAPVSPPPLSPAIKEGLKQGGGPVTQETQITQTLYRGAPVGRVAPGDMPGTTKKSMPCVSYLAALSGMPDSVGFCIEIFRKGPPIYKGMRLPFGVVERMDTVAPYPDIYERVKALHGGGSYELRVLNGDGARVHQMTFNIDTMTNPPILPTNGTESGMSVLGGGNPLAAVGGEADDILRARHEEQRWRAEESRMTAQARAENTARQIEKARRQENESEERRIHGPVQETQRIIDNLRGEMKDQKHDADRRMDALVSAMEKMMLALATKQQGGGDQMWLAEMMKVASQTNAQILTAIISSMGSKGGEVAEAMKLQAETNRQMVQMAIQSASGSGPKYEKLVEQLVMHKIEHPDNAVRQAIDLLNDGRKQAMDMFKVLEDVRADREPAEPVINPENGFFGNLGNLLLRGVEGMVSGAAKGGGSKVMDMLAAQMMKPAAGQVVSAPGALSVAGPRPLLPGPQGVPLPQAVTRLPRFERTYEVEDEPIAVAIAPAQAMPMPMPMPMPVTPEPPFAVPQNAPPVEAAPETSAPNVPSSSAPVEEIVDDDEAARTREVVNEAMQMAITDIKAGRRAHDWVDFALDKWDRVLLNSLIQAKDDTDRIALLQQYADPKLFEELVKLLMDTTHPENYKGFMENVAMLLEEATKEVVGA